MNQVSKLIKTKLGLLHLAEELGNISQACRVIGYNRNKTSGNSVESLAYEYNIRGWLLGINRNYMNGTSPGNYFGMELGYDKPTSVAGTTSYVNPQYNGNIEGAVWKSKGDGPGFLPDCGK